VTVIFSIIRRANINLQSTLKPSFLTKIRKMTRQMMRGMIRITTLLIGIFLMVLLLYHNVFATSGYSKIEKTYRIAVSNTPLSAPIFIAKQQGYFEEFGLDIELIVLNGGVKCFEALMSGVAQFATSSETVVMFNSFFHDDFAVLASFATSDNDLKLLSLTPEKHQDIDSFGRAKVGMVKGSASEFFIDNILMLHRKKMAFIERVYLKNHELIPALLAGEVDIISAWEPLGYHLSQAVIEPTRVLSTKGLYDLSFNLVAKKSINSQDDEARVRLLLALDKAIDLIAEHPNQIQFELSRLLDVPESQLQYSWRDYVFRLSLGNALVSNLQAQAQWAIENRLVPMNAQVDIRTIIDSSALETMNQQRSEW
jgi:ABC-type nitrate/sulfonate/bicarbonate transport system substrate-binding protein